MTRTRAIPVGLALLAIASAAACASAEPASPEPVAPTSAAADSPSPTESPDPQFDTCAEAKAAGYGPYVEGRDPEYDLYEDRNQNGIVCE